jgi:aminopeptidase N
VLVAGQPIGAMSWFPCDDHPAAKASFRIQIATDSPYYALANGRLQDKRVRAGMTTWTYEQAEPTSTYLITLQIGAYERHRMSKNGVDMHAVLPERLRRTFDHDFGRQPQMMKLFVKLFGPYPLGSGYTVVVTDDDLEIPLEAQGISIFGANHCDGRRGAERLIAHELAHQWFGNSLTVQRWRHIWLHEGFACYAEWLWSEHCGDRSADDLARHYHRRLQHAPQDLVLADPGPKDMFDDRVYKRGALTLHVLRRRLGDRTFFALLKDWAARHRHGSVVTDDFLGLAAQYCDEPLRPLWQAWLYSTEVPPLDATP